MKTVKVLIDLREKYWAGGYIPGGDGTRVGDQYLSENHTKNQVICRQVVAEDIDEGKKVINYNHCLVDGGAKVGETYYATPAENSEFYISESDACTRVFHTKWMCLSISEAVARGECEWRDPA